MSRQNIFKISSLFFCLCLAVTVSSAQEATIDDEKPDWSCRDTTKFTSTGFIGANIGLEPLNGVTLIGAVPIKQSHFCLAGKFGWGREVYYYSQSHVVNDIYLMVGGCMTFQLNTHYAFDVRLLAGVVHSPYPTVNYQDSIPNPFVNGTRFGDSMVHFNNTIQSINGFSIAFQGGIGFRYMFGGNIGLQLNVDYSFRTPLLQQVSSTQSFAYVTSTNSTNNTTTNKYYSLPPNTSNRNVDHQDAGEFAIISFGIYYQLGTAVLKQ